MSDTIWVAIIASLSAIVPQLITTFLNYRKDVKLKLTETYNQNKLNIITEFLDSLGNMYNRDGTSLGDKYTFQKASQKLLLYFPDININLFDSLFDSAKEWDTSRRLEILQPLIKQLSKSMQEK